MLSLDLATVFDNSILEAFAKETGWNDDVMSIEQWILLNSHVKVNIELENDINSNKQFIKNVVHSDIESKKCMIKCFHIPLIMCKDEFLSNIMKLCGYIEDRYNNENVIKYILDTQLKNMDDSYTQLYVEIPIMENY
jgi:hypothetical protein